MLAHVHARQPAIVDPSRFADWLDPEAPKDALVDIVRRPHPGTYAVRLVSRLVNNVRNDGPEVLHAQSSAPTLALGRTRETVLRKMWGLASPEPEKSPVGTWSPPLGNQCGPGTPTAFRNIFANCRCGQSRRCRISSSSAQR